MEWISYDTLLTVHLAFFVFNITLVIAADLNGLLWALGYIRTLHRRLMLWVHYLIGAGLTVSIISGALLFLTVDEYLLTVPAFYTKVGFVLALIINSYFIGRHVRMATERSFASLLASEKLPIIASAAVSAVAWVGVVVAAQFLGL